MFHMPSVVKGKCICFTEVMLHEFELLRSPKLLLLPKQKYKKALRECSLLCNDSICPFSHFKLTTPSPQWAKLLKCGMWGNVRYYPVAPLCSSWACVRNNPLHPYRKQKMVCLLSSSLHLIIKMEVMPRPPLQRNPCHCSQIFADLHI